MPCRRRHHGCRKRGSRGPTISGGREGGVGEEAKDISISMNRSPLYRCETCPYSSVRSRSRAEERRIYLLLHEAHRDLLEQGVGGLDQHDVGVGAVEAGPQRRHRVGDVRVVLLRLTMRRQADDHGARDVAAEGGEDGLHAQRDLPLGDALVQQELVVAHLLRQRAAPAVDVAHAVPGLRLEGERNGTRKAIPVKCSSSSSSVRPMSEYTSPKTYSCLRVRIMGESHPTKARGMLMPFIAIQSISLSQRSQPHHT